jgi:hypothetical protein
MNTLISKVLTVLPITVGKCENEISGKFVCGSKMLQNNLLISSWDFLFLLNHVDID